MALAVLLKKLGVSPSRFRQFIRRRGSNTGERVEHCLDRAIVLSNLDPALQSTKRRRRRLCHLGIRNDEEQLLRVIL